MTDRYKTMLLGVFVIIATLAMIGMLLFLRPSVGDGKKTLYVCFTSIEKIQVGTRVTFAGKPVGEVVSIDPIYDARNQPTGRSGHICFYELELRIDSHTVVYDTDDITVHTTGLLGERTIAIIPRAVKKGQPSYPVTDQVMYGKSGDPFEEMVSQVMTIGTKVSDTIDEVRDILQQNKAEIPLVLRSIRDAAHEMSLSFGAINSSHLVHHLNETVENFQGASSKLDTILGGWKEAGLAHSFPDLINNLSSITDALNDHDALKEIIANLRECTGNFKTFSSSMSPDGSIGRLFKNDEFYLQLTALMTKANILLDDFNQYGVLFHLNKSWQRERLRRVNLLAQLSCPGDFRNYFQCELNNISLSMSRIARSLQRARCNCNRKAILHDKAFVDGFSELLQRLDRLEDTLKCFREQMIESRMGGCR